MSDVPSMLAPRTSASPRRGDSVVPAAEPGGSRGNGRDGHDDPPLALTLAAVSLAALDQAVAGCALVLRSAAHLDRTGAPYLSLTLRGADGGRFEARWWRYPYPVDRRPQPGTICWFTGRAERYHGEPQLRITAGRDAPNADLAIFAPADGHPFDELERELQERIAALEPALAALVRTVLSGEVGERFRTWPAAQQRHGAVRHGLLAHSLGVTRIAAAIASAYDRDGLQYDADLVDVACLLHDVGKVHTLPAIAGGAPPERAGRFDHVTCGVLLVGEAARRTEPGVGEARLEALLHAILAHHGRREWGAPVEPETVEAWLVHLADLAESRLWKWSEGEEKQSFRHAGGGTASSRDNQE